MNLNLTNSLLELGLDCIKDAALNPPSQTQTLLY
jgi:hypothetical protein